MATLVIAGMPAAGHVNPTLPVVAELTRRGVDVTYAADAEFADRITGAGARFVPYPVDVLTSRDIAAATASGSSVAVVARILRATTALAPFLVDLLRAGPPAALLHDSNALWGRIAARTVGLPTISFMTTFFVGTAAMRALSLRESLTVAGPSLRDLPAAVRGRRAVLRRFGAGLVPRSPMLPMRGDLTVFGVPAELQPPDPRVDDSCHFVGTTTDPAIPTAPIDPDLAAHLSGDGPVVLVSLGTLHSAGPAFFRACRDALADHPARVVLATGGTDPAALGPLPANTVARRSVPQLAVLRRASVFVTHGGMNSALEGIDAGVPLVVVPQQVEQFLIGQALAERGAAVVLRQHLSHRPVPVDALRGAVERALTDPAPRTAAAELAQRFRAGGGAARAADLIEHLLTAH